MRDNLLTRDQAIARVGQDVINDLDKINCEPTSRVGVQGYPDDYTEWTASIYATDTEGEDVVVVAYYYTTNEQDQIMADNDGDGSSISWEVAGYEIV